MPNCRLCVDEPAYRQIDNGDWVCEYHYTNNVGICSVCGDLVILYNPSAPASDRMCVTCWDVYGRTCYNCGEVFNSLNDSHYYVTALGTRRFTYCSSCMKNYKICPECNCLYNGKYEYCKRCMLILGILPEINDHAYKPRLSFFKTDKDQNRPLYMGWELEVCCQNVDDMMIDLHDSIGDIVYYKYDGSLVRNKSVEIVSNPMTLEYMMDNGIFKKMEEVFLTHKVVSHDTDCCGFHIHVNRDFIYKSNSRYDWAYAMGNYIWLNRSDIVRISRRDEDALKTWAKIKNPDYYFDYTDRYTALNTRNNGTYEFRFFRGSILEDTLNAMVIFVDTMARQCNKNKIDQSVIAKPSSIYPTALQAWNDECSKHGGEPILENGDYLQRNGRVVRSEHYEIEDDIEPIDDYQLG